MRTSFVALAALAIGAAGGFIAGASLKQNATTENVSGAVAETAKQNDSGDAERLKRAQKRMAELERDLAAAKRAEAASSRAKRKGPESAVPATTNDATSNLEVVADGDVLEALEKQLPREAFLQVTNAMTQLRARLAEKAKGRMDFLAAIDTAGMTGEERENHAKFLSLMERREAAAAKMKGGLPDAETIQKLVELEVEMAPVAKKARSALVRQVARELGYQGDDVEVVRDTIDTIFDCTSSGCLGGLGDMMEGVDGTPGISVSPGVSVETHVIGL